MPKSNPQVGPNKRSIQITVNDCRVTLSASLETGNRQSRVFPESLLLTRRSPSCLDQNRTALLVSNTKQRGHIHQDATRHDFVFDHLKSVLYRLPSISFRSVMVRPQHAPWPWSLEPSIHPIPLTLKIILTRLRLLRNQIRSDSSVHSEWADTFHEIRFMEYRSWNTGHGIQTTHKRWNAGVGSRARHMAAGWWHGHHG